MLTKEERKRGALENFLAYFLQNEFDKKQLIELFVYNLSDNELESMVKQFNGCSATIPPIVPNSKFDTKRESPTQNVYWEYVNVPSAKRRG